MKRIAALLYVLITAHAVAQRDKIIAQKDRVNVELCIPCLIDFVNFPTIQGGIEYRFSPRISWYNEAGIGFLPALRRLDSTFVGTHGFKLKTEFRYYFKHADGAKSPTEDYYVGANAFFIKNSYNTSISYYPHPDSSATLKDEYGVRRQVWGINLIVGIRQNAGHGKISKKIMVDAYLGQGIRFRSMSTVGRNVGYGDHLDLPIDLNFYRVQKDAEIKGGFSILPNLTAGIRVCYRL